MLNTFTQTGLRFLWLSVLAIFLDQWTKGLILQYFELYQSVQITGFFNLTYVRNYGAAFSFLSDQGGWQRWFFTIIAIGVSVLILWWLKHAKKQQIMLSVAFCLVLGGAIGNVYDRIAYGYVIDFLDFHAFNWHWPAFNVADSSIFLGAVLLIVDMIKNKKDLAGNEQSHDNQENKAESDD
jgi:signal peptidase II